MKIRDMIEKLNEMLNTLKANWVNKKDTVRYTIEEVLEAAERLDWFLEHNNCTFTHLTLDTYYSKLITKTEEVWIESFTPLYEEAVEKYDEWLKTK